MGFFQDLLGQSGADAARGAAADTFNKQNMAIYDLKQYGDLFARLFQDQSQKYNPWIDSGKDALGMLNNGLGFGGDKGSAQFINAFQGTPGYTEGLNAGGDLIDRGAASRGMLNSGRTLKDLTRFGSDYANKGANDYLAKLFQQSNTGLGATQAQIGTVAQGLQGQLGTRNTAFGGQMQAAGTLGQGDIAAANATAAGSQNLFNTGANLLGKFLGGGSSFV